MTTGVKTINDVMGLDHTAKLDTCEDQKTKAGDHLVGDGGDDRHVDRRGHHGAPDPRHARRHLRPYRQPRLGIGRRHAARGSCPPAAPTLPGNLSRCNSATGSRSRWVAAAADFLPDSTADRIPNDEDKKGKRKDGKDLTKRLARPLRRQGRLCLEQGAVRRDRPGQDRSPARALRAVAHAIRVRPRRRQGRRALAGRNGRESDRHAVAQPGGLCAAWSRAGASITAAMNPTPTARSPTGSAMNEAVKAVLRKVESRRDADRRDRRPQPYADDRRLRQARQPNPRASRSASTTSRSTAQDGKTYTTISFANGPGGFRKTHGTADADHRRRRPSPTSCSSRLCRSAARHMVARISASTPSAPGRICSRGRSRRTTPSTS